MSLPIVEEAIPDFNIRPVDYPEHITAEAVEHLLYQRLYHKLVEKDYAKADKVRDALLPYIDIMDNPAGTEWMWRPIVPVVEET